jgi:hypothetical protein
MTRIRYSKEGNTLTTKQNFVLPTGQVVLGKILHNVTFEVRVEEVGKEITHYTSSEMSLKDAKNAVKQALAAMGIVFGVEIRTKKD